MTAKIRLRAGMPSDFSELRQLRFQVFCRELGIQEENYQDVFTDWYSRNIVLIKNDQLIGGVRIAFSREHQEHYISYLVISREHRKLSLLRLLFGAVLMVMDLNGIKSIRADSADTNLPMYLAIGCRIIGPKFKKYGFSCDWTPLTYVLGTNANAERRTIDRVAAFFPNDEEVYWRFKPNIETCESQVAYRERLSELIRARRIPGTVPHLGESVPIFGVPWIKRPQKSLCSPPEASRRQDDLDMGMKFGDLNDRVSKDHLIAARLGSPAADLARTYSVLTGKHLFLFSKWEEICDGRIPTANTVLLIFDSEDAPPRDRSLWRAMLSRSIGIAAASKLGDLSSLLLMSYFEFLGPRSRVAETVGNQWRSLIVVSDNERSQAIRCARQVSCEVTRDPSNIRVLALGNTHCILGQTETAPNVLGLLKTLLSSGFSIGSAVRFVNLAFASELIEPLVLIGDPNLRLTPDRPNWAYRSTENVDPNGLACCMCSTIFHRPLSHPPAQGDLAESLQD